MANGENVGSLGGVWGGVGWGGGGFVERMETLGRFSLHLNI